MRHSATQLVGLSGRPLEVELKFLVGERAAETFLAAVAPRLVAEIHDPSRPVAYSRTTYLDTAGLDDFRAAAAGVARHVRIRQYASAVTPGAPISLGSACFLELKESAGGVREKLRLAASPELCARLLAGDLDELTARRVFSNPTLRRLHRAVRDDARAPRVAVWYRRTACRGDGEVRITLDQDVTYCRPESLGSAGAEAGPRQPIGTGPERILEVKFRGAPPSWLAVALRALPQPARFSKFRQAMGFASAS